MTAPRQKHSVTLATLFDRFPAGQQDTRLCRVVVRLQLFLIDSGQAALRRDIEHVVPLLQLFLIDSIEGGEMFDAAEVLSLQLFLIDSYAV